MRTANQERLSSVCRALNLDERQRVIVERLINQYLKEAQLDDMKEGMRRAAMKTKHTQYTNDFRQYILTAAEQLTKDL